MKKPLKDRTVPNESRRTTLKTLFGGSGFVALSALPAQWVKPVVDAVVLPTHAQTSPRVAPNGFEVSLPLTTGQTDPAWWEKLIPAAHAGVDSLSGFLCIQSIGENSYDSSLQVGSEVFRGTGNFGDCVGLSCGLGDFDLVVTGKNQDGSFDFELYSAGSGCTGDAIEINTTDTPCDLEPELCLDDTDDLSQDTSIEL